MANDNIKIKMYDRHIALLPKSYITEVEHKCGIVSFASWIREKAYNDFGILIKDTNGIDELNNILAKNYYINIADWLREKIRNELL